MPDESGKAFLAFLFYNLRPRRPLFRLSPRAVDPLGSDVRYNLNRKREPAMMWPKFSSAFLLTLLFSTAFLDTLLSSVFAQDQASKAYQMDELKVVATIFSRAAG
jgi:hypothetical protein